MDSINYIQEIKDKKRQRLIKQIKYIVTGVAGGIIGMLIMYGFFWVAIDMGNVLLGG